MACSFLIAELNQKSGSGLCAEGFNVSCGTSLPKSPDRIAGIKKPRRDARAHFFKLDSDYHLHAADVI